MVFDPALGATLLFGGIRGGSATSSAPGLTCLNDTWEYVADAWASVAGAAPPPSCWTAMSYDSSAGAVVAYIAANATSTLDQTWEFRAGAWARQNVAGPSVTTGAGMADDPTQNGALLVGYPTSCAVNCSGSESWLFDGQSWTLVGGGPGCEPMSGCGFGGEPFDPAYDPAAGVPMMVRPPSTGGPGGDTWEWNGTTWAQASEALPGSAAAGPWGLAFDPALNEMLLYSESAGVGNGSGRIFETWTDGPAGWAALDLPEPPAREGGGVAFDGSDAYLLLFGGCAANTGIANNLSACVLADTWEFAPPPLQISIVTAASPASVCTATEPSCVAGTTSFRGEVSIEVAPAPPGGISGDTGPQTATYGPFEWLDEPTLTFLSWRNVTPATSLEPSAICTAPDASDPMCSPVPIQKVISSDPERSALTWNWSDPQGPDELGAGSAWNLSFSLQVLGPPFGPVPADSCTTVACVSAGSGTIDGLSSTLSFSPYGNSSRMSYSLPLLPVTVLPNVPTSTPPGTSPPPGPPASAGPIPAPVVQLLPTGPTPVGASPVAVGTTPVPVAALPLAAAILTAGLTRILVAQKAHAVRNALLVRAPNGRPRRTGPDVRR